MKNISQSIPKYLFFLAFILLGQGNIISSTLTSGIVDLSHWNRNVNLTVAKRNGIIAVIHKATEGVDVVDPDYARRRKEAENLNILWGAYHFATGSNGKDQADHFLKTVGETNGILLAIDLEINKSGTDVTHEIATEFINRFYEKTNNYPHVYGPTSFLSSAEEPITKCPLWIATWGEKPIIPKGWNKFVLWQHTDGTTGCDTATVPGIGKCDKNKFNGTLQALNNYWSSQNIMS